MNIQNNTLMFIKSFSNSTWKGSYRLRNHQVNQPTKLIPFVKFTTITYVIRNCILYTIIYLFPLSFCPPLQIETLKKTYYMNSFSLIELSIEIHRPLNKCKDHNKLFMLLVWNFTSKCLTFQNVRFSV